MNRTRMLQWSGALALLAGALCCAHSPGPRATPPAVQVTPEIPAARWTVEFLRPEDGRAEYLACKRSPGLQLECYDLSVVVDAVKEDVTSQARPNQSL